jgi:HAD superfamily hydrolase (TIGR01549 family)
MAGPGSGWPRHHQSGRQEGQTKSNVNPRLRRQYEFRFARRPGLLFDVDGTLLDTNYLHTLTWARSFADAGEWAPMNAIHRLVGMGSDRLVVELLGHECPAAVEARPHRYGELINEARAFPGATDLLQYAHDQGLGVVIATSAVADELSILLGKLGAHDAIDAITTADDITEPKPDPEVFLKAMAAGSIDSKHVLAVGDSVWDIKAARAAGIGCIAVESSEYGEHDLQRLERSTYTETRRNSLSSFTPVISGLCCNGRP